MTQQPFFTKLKDRGLIKISGKDRLSFLQGLISNDIFLLEKQPALYSCILTPQGKFLYDFFITQNENTLFLDCEGGARAESLAKLLILYKLRAEIEIAMQPHNDVFAIFGAPHGYPDPRHADIGTRSFEKPNDVTEQSFSTWDALRIRLRIPDGSRDMVVGQSTLLECGIDKLNGVSFDKGCYMGQELTARMHYRGLAKKQLKTVYCHPEQTRGILDPSASPQDDKIILDFFPPFGEQILHNGQIIGEMRSACNGIGLALLKDDIKV